MTTILIALILSTILPPPWNAPTATPTPALVWSKTPIAPLPTPKLIEPVRRVTVWLPVVLAAKVPPEGK